MLYNIVDHPFLTQKAAAVHSAADPAKFEANVTLAEALLGLHGTTIFSAPVQSVDGFDVPVPLTTTEEEQLRNHELIRLALADQVNFQVEQGVDPLVVASMHSNHSKQGVTYRNRWISPRAAAIVAQVVGVEDIAGRYSGKIISVRNSGRSNPDNYVSSTRLR